MSIHRTNSSFNFIIKFKIVGLSTFSQVKEKVLTYNSITSQMT